MFTPLPPPKKKKKLALLDEPQSTLKNETLSDLVDETNQANNLSEKVDERSVNFKIVFGTLTSSNDTKGDLTIGLNQHQTGGFLLKRITMHGVCMKEREKLSLRINDLPSPTSPNQDILFLRSSNATKSWSRWMIKQFLGESAICLTGLNKSGPLCNKV